MAFMICDRQPMPRQRLFLIGLIVCLHVRSIWGGPAMFQVIDLSESVATPEISTHSEKPFHVVAIASDTYNSPEKDVIIEKATGLKNIEQNRILHVTDANGTKYACHLPPKGSLTLNDESKSCSNIDSDIDQEGVCKEEALLHSNPSDSDKEGHIESPEEILDSLGDWCAYKLDGWWTYEVCYKKQIRQYHSEENEITQQFNLGNYVAEDTDMTKVRIETGVTGKEMRYALQSYRHGDACDLTGQKRTTDVKYTCSASSESPTIVDIQETSSCAYTATIAISELCQHPDFVEVQSPPILINCYIISPREDSKSIQNKQS